MRTARDIETVTLAMQLMHSEGMIEMDMATEVSQVP
jgi:hypothetical protein